LFSEPLVLGYIDYANNTRYLFSNFGFTPKYIFVLTSKNGLEVTAYTYYRPSADNLQMNITLFNYSNKTFDCFGYTETDYSGNGGSAGGSIGCEIDADNGTSNIPVVFSIHAGVNEISTFIPTVITSDDFTGLSIGFNLNNPWSSIYKWTVSDGVGQITYKSNPLIPDKYAYMQNGFIFSQERLLNTILYLWLPILLIFAIGFAVYQTRRRLRSPS
jgi:hypothetical protein